MFNFGDKVKLKSGGPILTVVGFSPRGNVWVESELKDRTRHSTLADAQAGVNGRPAVEEYFLPPECLILHQQAYPAT